MADVQPTLRRTSSRRPTSRYLSEYYEDSGYPVMPGSADAVENMTNSVAPEETAAEEVKGQEQLNALEDWLCELDLHYDSASYRCIMVGCPEERFATPEDMIAHLQLCELFPEGKYRCPTAMPPNTKRGQKSSKFSRGARKLLDLFRRPVSKQTQCSKCGWPLKESAQGLLPQYHEEWAGPPSIYSASSASSPRRASFCSDTDNNTRRGSLSTSASASVRSPASNLPSPTPSPRLQNTSQMPGNNIDTNVRDPLRSNPTSSPLDELKPLPDLRKRASNRALRHQKRNSMPVIPSMQQRTTSHSRNNSNGSAASTGDMGARPRAGTWDTSKRNSVAVNPQARPQRRPSQQVPAHHRHTIGGTSPTFAKTQTPQIDFAREMQKARETVRPADTRMSMVCFDPESTLMMGMMEYDPATDNYQYDGTMPRPEQLGEMDLRMPDFSETFGSMRRSFTRNKRASFNGGASGGQSSKRSSYIEV